MEKVNKRMNLRYKGRVWTKICPRCWGTGTFDNGEQCYYCKGAGSVAD